ncbi:MAG: nicotinate-nucleotide--dimethylbenzimidazole phosphoribosyltransferase, partial [Lachnospiraceae bacterium]|nr:nicotinate-nucleotide--dimethylbenzimidazole phosphoribosyltransferase [Lachnospiraceae bacterium]
MTENELLNLKIEKPSKDIYVRAKESFDRIAKPIDGLGVFEDLVCSICAVQGSTTPDITKKALVIMCADNGVVSEGVSQTDKSVTASVAELMGKNR